MSRDDLLELAGFICLVAAAALLHPAAAFAVAGVLLIASANVGAGRRDDDGTEG